MKTKHILQTLALLLLVFVASAQQGINYKAIINDAEGNALANTEVTVQFTILENSTTNVYQETHSTTTDANGIIIINIGEGTPISGDFSIIDWGSNPYFLKVEINKGDGLIDLGTTEFKAVPYALYAKTAEDAAKKTFVDQLVSRIEYLENIVNELIPDTNIDNDGDGVTIGDGDCDDNNDTVYPGAVEVPGDGIDQDCSGFDSFEKTSQDPVHAANAIGIYEGLISAEWILPDGTPIPDFDTYPNYTLGFGILNSFGPNIMPREGDHILVLSTGTARLPGDNEYLEDFNKGYTINFPDGFPVANSNCPTPGPGFDGVALKITLLVPENASGFTLDFKYYTADYPQYICSEYVDQAAGIIKPVPEGWSNGNIFFDSQNNYLSAESCNSGDAELQGTGFEEHGSTDWLQASSPVTPNSTIEFAIAIWDSGDGSISSTLLVDNWQWIKN